MASFGVALVLALKRLFLWCLRYSYLLLKEAIEPLES
jgi:hypothetical protein